MQIISDATIDFKPPQSGRWGMPLALALVVHLLLMAALTWGIHWRDEEPPVTFEAEIWSTLPQEAAPRAVEPLPPPEPEPQPQPQPEPEPQPQPEPQPAPKPEPKPVPHPPQSAVKQPDIATEKAKKKQEEDRQRELEEARKVKAAKEKAEKDAREKKEKELADKKKAEEQKKLAEKKEQERKDTEKRANVAAEKNRKDQLARMMGQIGASGGPEARGSAAQSANPGPSSGYAARVAAKIRPNIRYSEEFPRSLRTEVEVRALPDGTITGRRVVESSGNPAWDDAALKAIDRTGSLPRDVDGRVPTPLIIVVRPTD